MQRQPEQTFAPNAEEGLHDGQMPQSGNIVFHSSQSNPHCMLEEDQFADLSTSGSAEKEREQVAQLIGNNASVHAASLSNASDFAFNHQRLNNIHAQLN